MDQQDQPRHRVTLYHLPALRWAPPAMWSVLLCWGLATGIGMLPACIPAWIGILLMFSINSESTFVIIALITAGAMATPIALLQRIAHGLVSDINGWWVRATVAGAMTGVGLSILDRRFDVSSPLIWFLFGDNYQSLQGSLEVMFGLIGCAVGFFQWLVLRRKFEHAGWWIIANLLAGLVIGWIGEEVRGDELMLGFLQLLAYTLITGGALRLLLAKPRFDPGQD